MQSHPGHVHKPGNDLECADIQSILLEPDALRTPTCSQGKPLLPAMSNTLHYSRSFAVATSATAHLCEWNRELSTWYTLNHGGQVCDVENSTCDLSTLVRCLGED